MTLKQMSRVFLETTSLIILILIQGHFLLSPVTALLPSKTARIKSNVLVKRIAARSVKCSSNVQIVNNKVNKKNILSSYLTNDFNLEQDEKIRKTESSRYLDQKRRYLLQSLGLSTGLFLRTQDTHAENSPMNDNLNSNNGDVENSFQMDDGLLESRVLGNVMSPTPFGMEIPDISYPRYFSGVWNVVSVTSSVEAPCGEVLFGGNATFARAQREVGSQGALTYRARFVSDEGGSTIADREFNVREIAKAAMGSNSVVDVPLATPNKLSCILTPTGANTMMRADLITTARRQENIDDKNFHCSEVVRQIVAPLYSDRGRMAGGQTLSANPLLKEVETTSLYTAPTQIRSGGKNSDVISEIRCVQRSATFLLPSQSDPMAYKMWQFARGRPIDVRYYDVTYTRI
eukprot:CAMPEP_0184858738 /NCGR_PEP_ID=MMETSP0580-20130426/3810_1 /TAXON_ID=1118495 /ORGANISM="Dactyliosolen fragilissimus" /LENGTH=402 /DNA_ID=CAMNT_0027355041 /DNA_START=34 /DNA_END=1242 /DNA_ORIENTATION=+